MDFNNSVYKKNIQLLYIDDFDVDAWDDANRLRNIFTSLFNNNNNNNEIFFSFRREEDLTSDKELARLRISIIEKFNKFGEYTILSKLDDSRFDSVARIGVNDFTFEFLLDLWKYFYSCAFFIPSQNFSFAHYISFQKKIKFTDIYGERLLYNKYSNFECMKGLGGDNLFISYFEGYKLPDIRKIATDTPNINKAE